MGEQPPKLGRVAYSAYRDSTGGKSLVSGAPIPTWEKLPALIQNAWNAAADAVSGRVLIDELTDAHQELKDRRQVMAEAGMKIAVWDEPKSAR